MHADPTERDAVGERRERPVVAEPVAKDVPVRGPAVPPGAPRSLPRRICGEGLSEADRLVGYRSSLAAEVAQLREVVAALLADRSTAFAPPESAPTPAARALPAASGARPRRARA